MNGRHPTNKKPGDPTYSAQWSGVSYAPHALGKHCPTDGTLLHREGHDSLYCPTCDDYVRAVEDGGKPCDANPAWDDTNAQQHAGKKP